jgi:hypothetical protein
MKQSSDLEPLPVASTEMALTAGCVFAKRPGGNSDVDQ